MLPSFVSLSVFVGVVSVLYIFRFKVCSCYKQCQYLIFLSDPEIITVLLGAVSFQLVFSVGTFAIVFHFSLFLITSSHSVSD